VIIMAPITTKNSWRKQRRLVLRKLDAAWSNGPQGDETHEQEIHQKARSITSKIRRELAQTAMKNGRLLRCAKLSIGPAIAWIFPSITKSLGDYLKDAGHPNHAMVLYGAAAYQATQEAECYKNIFELGHCAKLAGRYGLAVECFAHTLMLGHTNNVQDISRCPDLEIALAGLTRSFSLR